MATLTVNLDLIDLMKKETFIDYLKALYPPDSAVTGQDETEMERLAREERLAQFVSQLDAIRPLGERVLGWLQCVIRVATAYMNCRHIYPNYPAALECDQNAVNGFTHCFLGS